MDVDAGETISTLAPLPDGSQVYDAAPETCKVLLPLTQIVGEELRTVSVGTGFIKSETV
jgi:hypothetical protein